MGYKLSILICSLQSRNDKLIILLAELQRQHEHLFIQGSVEVLTCVDNKEKTTGAKRQELLEQAKGKYIIFTDDDDWPAPYYIEEMLKAIESGADCIGIEGTYIVDGGHPVRWKLSKDYDNEDKHENGELILYRKTNHITAVKRDLALKAGFPDKSNAEDKAYSEALNPHLKTEYRVEKPMYEYRYSSHNKEYK